MDPTTVALLNKTLKLVADTAEDSPRQELRNPHADTVMTKADPTKSVQLIAKTLDRVTVIIRDSLEPESRHLCVTVPSMDSHTVY